MCTNLLNFPTELQSVPFIVFLSTTAVAECSRLIQTFFAVEPPWPSYTVKRIQYVLICGVVVA